MHFFFNRIEDISKLISSHCGRKWVKINEDNRLYLDNFIIVIALPALFYDFFVCSEIINLALPELLYKTAKRDQITQIRYFCTLLLSLIVYGYWGFVGISLFGFFLCGVPDAGRSMGGIFLFLSAGWMPTFQWKFLLVDSANSSFFIGPCDCRENWRSQNRNWNFFLS